MFIARKFDLPLLADFVLLPLLPDRLCTDHLDY